MNFCQIYYKQLTISHLCLNHIRAPEFYDSETRLGAGTTLKEWWCCPTLDLRVEKAKMSETSLA